MTEPPQLPAWEADGRDVPLPSQADDCFRVNAKVRPGFFAREQGLPRWLNVCLYVHEGEYRSEGSPP